MMNYKMITAICALLVMGCKNHWHPMSGMKVMTSQKSPACETIEYFDSLKEKLRAYGEDEQAERAAVLEALQSGQCILLEKGETIFVTDIAVMTAMTKVRREGDTNEYWTPEKNLTCPSAPASRDDCPSPQWNKERGDWE